MPVWLCACPQELCTIGSLSALLSSGAVRGAWAAGQLCRHLLLNVLQQVACGMAYLHARVVVHGDLHAGNVLLCMGQQPELSEVELVGSLNRKDKGTSTVKDVAAGAAGVKERDKHCALEACGSSSSCRPHIIAKVSGALCFDTCGVMQLWWPALHSTAPAVLRCSSHRCVRYCMHSIKMS